MGYHTDFFGSFALNKPLTSEQIEYLKMFAETRRMKRVASKIATLSGKSKDFFGKESDAVNTRCLELLKSLKMDVGPEGAYYCGVGDFGQARDESVVDGNTPPSSQPGRWCQWVPTDDGTAIEWNGTEKFYDYVEWIEYLIANFLKPWGYVLNGEVEWQGEERDDRGLIVIKKNKVTTKKAKVTWE